MTVSFDYPLAQVLTIKKRRVEQAEKVVKERKKELEKEEEKLLQVEKERDKVLKHRQDKIDQMRQELDGGTTTDKIIQMKNYLEVVEERVQTEEKKVADQKEQVEEANKKLEMAKRELFLKRQEVDKLEQHKTDWKKQMRLEQQIIEGRELDEIGNITYLLHQRMQP